MVNMIDQIKSKGDVVNIYDGLAIKSAYNEKFYSDDHASPGFLEAYLKLKEAKGEKIE